MTESGSQPEARLRPLETLETWTMTGEWTDCKGAGNLPVICRTTSGTELPGPSVSDSEARRQLTIWALNAQDLRQEPWCPLYRIGSEACL